MPDSNKSNTGKPTDTDTSSFSSILASVAKMRNAASVTTKPDEAHHSDPSQHTSTHPTPSSKRPNQPHYQNKVSSFRTAHQVLSDSSHRIPSRRPKQVIIRGQSGQRASYDATRHSKLRKQTFRSIQVNKNQNGNPLLSSLSDVSYEFNGRIHDIDYLINSHCFAIFLSIKYHKLHPEYIYHRIKRISYNPDNKSMLRILLVLVDVDRPDDSMRELNKICLYNNLTLLTAWSFEQCGDYISALKQCETNAGQKLIQGNSKRNNDMNDDSNYYERVVDTLTSVKTINKTDAVNLVSRFGNLKDLCQKANQANLHEVTGMGQHKIDELLKAINDPFVYK